MNLLFLGDIHGQYQGMLDACRENTNIPRIYQLGDFGFGFPPLANDLDLGVSTQRYSAEDAVILPPNLRIIRGNHDCPSSVIGHPSYLGDYGVDEFGVGYISGAMSIDQHIRIPGQDWWHDEELNLMQLNSAVDTILDKKPRIIISHTSPYAFEFFLEKWPKSGRTNQALDELWKYHAPELWICGHHHVNEVKRLKETIFCCVNANKALRVEVPSDRPIAMRDLIFE